jgi:hypothetical protein
MTDDFENKKKEIQDLGLSAIKDYFSVDISKMDKEFIHNLHNKAKIGMQFEREMSVSKRAVEMNYIRVFRLIAEDKQELKNYLKKSPMKTYLLK